MIWLAWLAVPAIVSVWDIGRRYFNGKEAAEYTKQKENETKAQHEQRIAEMKANNDARINEINARLADPNLTDEDRRLLLPEKRRLEEQNQALLDEINSLHSSIGTLSKYIPKTAWDYSKIAIYSVVFILIWKLIKNLWKSFFDD